MIRKLLIVLLSGALCLFIAAPLLAETNWGWSTPQEYEEATGNKIEKFHEAPMLRLKVAIGELPPIEERLPEEPLIEKPLEEVGTYGGIFRMSQEIPTFWFPASLYTTTEYILMVDRRAEKIIPNIAKGWEFSEDGKTFTLYFRKGMKWSDGAPFTADDILFYWEAVMLNDEITPVKPKQYMPGGELMTVEKVDDYAVTFHFSQPYWNIVGWICGAQFAGRQNTIFLPRHALAKYHIDYNSEANELAEEAGYDHWWQLFNVKRDFLLGRQPSHEGIPTLGPWMVREVLTEGVVYDRNPYYFKVDTAGNQLPYIDTVTATLFGDEEVKVLRMISGDYDYLDWFVSLKDYSVFMEGAESGGYNVWLARTFRTSSPSYMFNQNYVEDPVVAEILRDVRFRRALSLAVNREEFNELFAFGKGTPGQGTAHPSCSFYKEEWATTYAEYDPDRANEILDEMGLNERDKDGYRLRPDGEPLFLIIQHCTAVYPAEWSELIKEYWGDVGIKVAVKPVDRNYHHQLVNSGQHMITLWDFNNAAEFSLMAGTNYENIPGVFWAPLWRMWWLTNGEGGEEPPDEVKRMWSLHDSLLTLSKEEASKVLTEVFDIFAENLWEIGIIGLVPTPGLTNVNLGNVDMDAYTTSTDVGNGTLNRLYQLFWKK